MTTIENLKSGDLVKLNATGEIGRITRNGCSRGWWFGDVNGRGWYVYGHDVTPLVGAELTTATTAFAT